MYITRNIEKTLKKQIKNFPALALTGPRQSGKSTTLKQIFPDYQYISFDDLSVINRANDDINLFMDTLSEKVIFDEIQYFPDITRYIKIKIDKNRNIKGRFILTGSSQFSMIKNLTETLAGRIGILNLFPFDLMEIKKAKDKAFLDYFFNNCLYTAFPEPAIKKDKSFINLWLSTYIKTYIEKDIRMIYDIGSLREFQLLIQLLATRIGQLLNINDISKELGISNKTIKRWMSILEASYLIYLLPPYHNNLGKRITKHPKIYFLDCGLAAYLVGIHTKNQLLKSPFTSQLFENFCIQEIIKYCMHTDLYENGFYFYRTNYGLEVDFIIEKSFNSIIPIEIKYSKTPKRIMIKNLQTFIEFSKDITINNPLLLCPVDEKIPLSKNIYAGNIFELF